MNGEPSVTPRNFLERLLGGWGLLAAQRQKMVLLGAGLLTVLLLPFALRALTHLDANLQNQVSGGLTRFQVLRELSEDFGGDILAAVVSISEKHTPEQVQELKAFGNLLTAELAKIGTPPPGPLPASGEGVGGWGWLRHVECRTGQGLEQALKRIAEQRPYVLLTAQDVAELKKKFEPAALDEALNQIARTLQDLPPNSAEKERLREDPLNILETGRATLRQRLAERKEAFATDPEGYFISPDGTTLLVLSRTALPATSLDFDRALLAAVYRAEARARQAFETTRAANSKAARGTLSGDGTGSPTAARGTLRVGYTGMPVIAAENEMSLKYDLIVNTVSSLLLVLLLFLVVYRSLTLTWDVTWTTVLMILWTVAVAGMTKGHLSLLGGAFTAVPVGLGTDYTILVYNTFQTLRRSGTGSQKQGCPWHTDDSLSAAEAMRRTLMRCGPSILTASLITAIAFLGVSFTRLTGLAEFGFLGGISALLGAGVVLFILPAALCLPSRIPSPAPHPTLSPEGRGKATAALGFGIPAWGRMLEHAGVRWAALGAGVLVLLLGAALIWFGPDPGPETVAGVRFDPELGNLRSLRIKAIPLRRQLAEKFGLGLADLRVVVEAADEDHAFAGAQEVVRRLQPYLDKGELKHESSILDFIPSGQQQRETIAALKSFDVEAAMTAFRAAAVSRFGDKGLVFFKPFLRRLNDLKLLLRNPTVLTLASLMEGPLANFMALYVKVGEGESPSPPWGEGGASAPDEGAGPRPAAPSPLPLSPRGRGGRVLLALSWFPANLEMPEQWYDGIAKLVETNPPEGVKVQMTAARMVGFELKRSVLSDCAWITAVVGVCVAASLAVALRSLLQFLLAAIPLVFAYVFMLAGVPLCQALHRDFSLNFVNLMMFPLLLGSAIDYGVYLVFDAYSPRRPSISQVMSGTGCAVLYCMGTTLIAFGSFVTSSYTGLISMGVASLFGYTGALFGALVVLPALLGMRRNDEGGTMKRNDEGGTLNDE